MKAVVLAFVLLPVPGLAEDKEPWMARQTLPVCYSLNGIVECSPGPASRIAAGTRKPFPKRDYILLAGSMAADYSSTRYLLSKGGREVNPLLKCSPPRAGCISTPKFIALNGIPLAALALFDYSTPAGQPPKKFRKWAFRIMTSVHFGLAVSNTVQAAR